MKKVERINTMMRYINNRGHFTISELMTEFQVSRATAIRDVREIEASGMPLVSEVGRDGGYSVIQNSLLPAIRFKDDEVKALFLAFMATRNQQLPYLKSRQSLTEKLLGLLSESQQEELIILNQLIQFASTNAKNPELLELSDQPSPMVEKVIRLALKDVYLNIVVEEGNRQETSFIYLLHLYQENGAWLIDGFDLDKKEEKIIFVKDILEINLAPSKNAWTEKKIRMLLTQQAPVNNFKLQLSGTAISQFKKYHPIHLLLAYTSPFQSTAIVKGFIDLNDSKKIQEAINWLLFLGEECKILEIPDMVEKKLQERIQGYIGKFSR